MEKLKILHIIPVFATGGAERLVLQYAQLFDTAIYEVYVASCVEDGPLRDSFEQIDAVNVFVGSRESMGGRRSVYHLLEQYADKIQPDIVHTHMLSADFFGYQLKRKYGNTIRWVSTMHNVETATSWPRQVLWKYILRNADRVVSVSEKVEEFTKKAFHIQGDRSIVLRNGIRIKEWHNIPLLSYSGESPVRIASVGRFWEQKGHTYLLRALASIDIQYELHLFGDGPLRMQLEKEAISLGIQEHITWHGVVSDIPKQITDIDLIIQPSLWEGLSLVVMEMMAAGRPVITTPAGGDELITDTETGYIVPARNVQALADAIVQVSSDPFQMSKVALAAREQAIHNFDMSQNISGLQDIYREVWV